MKRLLLSVVPDNAGCPTYRNPRRFGRFPSNAPLKGRRMSNRDLIAIGTSAKGSRCSA
jgi:hypothetical protein